MWHNLVWIGGIWLVATIIAWFVRRWRGYSVAAWSVTIIAFCLGLFIGAETPTGSARPKSVKSYPSLARFPPPPLALMSTTNAAERSIVVRAVQRRRYTDTNGRTVRRIVRFNGPILSSDLEAMKRRRPGYVGGLKRRRKLRWQFRRVEPTAKVRRNLGRIYAANIGTGHCASRLD
jgi:hypothetical protein